MLGLGAHFISYVYIVAAYESGKTSVESLVIQKYNPSTAYNEVKKK